MAKKSYIGINGTARKIKKWYIGVNGTARKVKKAYIGVNGIARQFYSSDSYRWDRYSVVSGKGLRDYYSYSFRSNSPNAGRIEIFNSGRRNDFYVGFTDTIQEAKEKAISIARGNTFDYSRLEKRIEPRDYYTINKDVVVLANGDQETDGSFDFVRSTSSYFYEVTIDPEYYNDRCIYLISHSGSTVYVNGYTIDNNVQSKGSYIDTVESENPNAYPSNGVFNGYWYVRR